MRTNTLNPLHFIFPVFAKIILWMAVLVYGVFNFSTHHWVILGLLIVAVMAISGRISRLTVKPKAKIANQRTKNSDGGTFSHSEKNRQTRIGRPIVKDGGLFRRKQ